MSNLIQLEHVCKGYETAAGRSEVLRDIDLEVQAGEFLAIVGKSGSGKSTLLNMMTGIDHPDSGSVRVDGAAVHQLDEARLARWRGRHVGIVFQFFQLIPTLSILENLLLVMAFVNVVPKHARRKRALDLLNRMGIAGHEDKLPAALSGGQQQRAAIARALANNPPILVADEPTGNLDSVNAESIQGLFKSLAEAGTTVIVVTHDDALSAGYRRVITLKDGVIAGERINADEGQRPCA